MITVKIDKSSLTALLSFASLYLLKGKLTKEVVVKHEPIIAHKAEDNLKDTLKSEATKLLLNKANKMLKKVK